MRAPGERAQPITTDDQVCTADDSTTLSHLIVCRDGPDFGRSAALG
jgi:hypothetical protein